MDQFMLDYGVGILKGLLIAAGLLIAFMIYSYNKLKRQVDKAIEERKNMVHRSRS